MQVALCDDHKLMMDGQRSALEVLGYTVVIMAPNGRELLRSAQTGIQIDLAVVALSMPGLSGIDTIIRLLQMQPKAKCIVMSMHDDPAWVTQAMASGVVGYLSKTTDTSAFIDAVRVVVAGETYVSPELGYSLALYGGRRVLAERVMSVREREVLKLFCDGCSDKEIGMELGISPRTARFHLESLRRDFGCRTRADLIRLAMRHHVTDCGCGQSLVVARSKPLG